MATILKVGTGGGYVGRCDARCHEAKNPKCDCVCGGRYHGALLQGPQELAKRLQRDNQWTLDGVEEGDIDNAQTPLFAEERLPNIKEGKN